MLLFFSLYIIFGLALAALAHYLLDQDLITEQHMVLHFGLIVLVSLIFSLPFIVYVLVQAVWNWISKSKL